MFIAIKQIKYKIKILLYELVHCSARTRTRDQTEKEKIYISYNISV